MRHALGHGRDRALSTFAKALRRTSRLWMNHLVWRALESLQALPWIDRPGRWGESAGRVWRADPFSWKLKPRFHPSPKRFGGQESWKLSRAAPCLRLERHGLSLKVQ